MRKLPTFETDGYQLDNGEERHLESPETFHMPPREEREALNEGDIAKLMFDIMIDGDDENLAFERMWVKVVDCQDGVYSGELDNIPACSDEGEIPLELGSKVYFRPEHVIIFYTVEELEKQESDRKEFIDQATYETAERIQNLCRDRKTLEEMLVHQVPILEVLEKFDLDFPEVEEPDE